MSRKKIVTIGGGTGSFMLLSGLRKYDVDLSAVVSMADDGGSTGKLRDELGVLPPGDIRQCLVALSDSSEILRDLLSYRFESGGLRGHNAGNIILSALEKVCGSMEAAIQEASQLFHISGRIIPITTKDARLVLHLKNGATIYGQNAIAEYEEIQKHGVKKLAFEKSVSLNPEAKKAITQADIIIIGPGNHFGSILPNLAVSGMRSALKKSHAKIIYITNVTNKHGQTAGYSSNEYLEDIAKYIGNETITHCIVNTEKPSDRLIKKYERKEGAEFLVQLSHHHNFKGKIITGAYLSKKKPIYSSADAVAHRRSFIRHDSDKLAKAIIRLIK